MRTVGDLFVSPTVKLSVPLADRQNVGGVTFIQGAPTFRTAESTADEARAACARHFEQGGYTCETCNRLVAGGSRNARSVRSAGSGDTLVPVLNGCATPSRRIRREDRLWRDDWPTFRGQECPRSRACDTGSPATLTPRTRRATNRGQSICQCESGSSVAAPDDAWRDRRGSRRRLLPRSDLPNSGRARGGQGPSGCPFCAAKGESAGPRRRGACHPRLNHENPCHRYLLASRGDCVRTTDRSEPTRG